MEKYIIYEDYDLWAVQDQDRFKKEIQEEREMDEVSDDFADEENRQYFDDEFDEDSGNWREVIGDCPVVVTGVLGLWDGPHKIVPTRVRNLSEAVYKCLEGLNSIYEDKKGNLCIDAHHHDGCNHFKIMKYKDPNRPADGVKPMNYLGRR